MAVRERAAFVNDAAGQASARLALRWGLGLGVVPVAGALLLLGLASVFPIRLDYRSFYDQRRLEGVGLPQAAEGFVYASADEGELNLRLVRHGLRGLSFPDRSVTWLVLGDGKAPAWADFAVDGAGGVVARGAQPGAVDAGAGAPGPLAERTRSALAQGAVVYDAPATRAEMEQRLPWLKAAACVVIARPAEALSALVVRRPASVFSWRRVARTASLVGTVLGVAALCALHRRGPVPLRWTLVAVAPLLAAALVVWSAALGTSVGAGMPGPWPYALWGATSALVVWRLRRGDGSCFAGLRPAPWWGAVAALAVGLLFLHVVRLDFDWDMHTHWLPMTRYLYRWGHHDPQAIMQCGGDIRAAAYPYGNAVLLAVFAWTADVPRQAAYLLGPETALAVLLYRGWVGFSYVALLLAVAGFMRAGLSPRQHGAGLAIVGVLSVMLVFPTAAGMPLASETMMLPFFGAAILLVAAGAAMGDARALILGGVLLGVSCFLKLEAGIILGFSVLPWLALLRLGARHPGRVSWRALAVWLVPSRWRPSLSPSGG